MSQSSEFWHLVARIQWNTGFQNAAIRTLKSGQKFPTDEILLARYLADSGQYAESLEIFQRIGFEDHADLERMGHCMTMLGRWTEAVPTLQSAASEKPLSVSALCDLSDSCASLGMYAEARNAAEELCLSERPVAGFYRLGLMEFEQSRFKSCITEWSKILDESIHPGDLPVAEERLWLTFVTICLSEANRDEAARGLERLPDSASKHYLAGNLAEFDGKPEAAKTEWETAIQQDPALSEARLALAKQHIRTSSFEEAFKLLEPLASSSEDSSSVELCSVWQSIYSGLGQTDKAEQWKKRRDELRHREVERERLNRRATDPSTLEFRVLRAWRLATVGNRHQAKLLVAPIVSEMSRTPGSEDMNRLATYVRVLVDAIDRFEQIPDPYDFLAGSE